MNISIDQVAQWIIKLQHTGIINYGSIEIYLCSGLLVVDYRNKDAHRQLVRRIDGRSINRVHKEIKNFIVDIYYDYERTGEPVSLQKLCGILGVRNRSTTMRYVQKIENKIKQKLQPFII